MILLILYGLLSLVLLHKLYCIQLLAYDYDAESPNNKFDVILNEGCPLEPQYPNYTCEKGSPATVQFLLARPLDYDVMKEPFHHICNVTLINVRKGSF